MLETRTQLAIEHAAFGSDVAEGCPFQDLAIALTGGVPYWFQGRRFSRWRRRVSIYRHIRELE